MLKATILGEKLWIDRGLLLDDGEVNLDQRPLWLNSGLGDSPEFLPQILWERLPNT